MKVLLSWIRDFVDVPGTAEEIGARMSLRGLAIEGIEPAPSGPQPPGREDTGPDALMDFDVTANRPDCLSVVGIAREIACAYGLPLRRPGPNAPGLLKTPDVSVAAHDTVSVTIDEPELCARFAAAVADVQMGASPDWMQARLRALGVRPISNIVDITNYVVLELGQPMHAYDFAKLEGPALVARRGRAGETLRTLDGKVRALDADMLIIADASRPVGGIGGVMGGADTEVDDTTSRIVFEAAWFKPQAVRAASKRLGLRTEASQRFEKGADLTAQVRAIARALALVEHIGAGTSSGKVIDAYPTPFQPTAISLSLDHVRGLLGMDVPADAVERILRALGFDVRALGGWHAADVPPTLLSLSGASPTFGAPPASAPSAAWQVEAPGWRVDMRRPVDLIEEIGRHYGFEHLPATFPGVEQAPPPSDPRIARDTRVRHALLGMGFSEAISFAFIEAAAAEPFLNGQPAIDLANPLSEKFTTMRPSLIPGLIDAVSHNRRRERRDVRLFEIGTRFTPRGEHRAAAVAWTGLATADHWSGARRDVDFFDVKGVVEQLCALAGVMPTVAPASVSYLVDGRSARVSCDGRPIGVVGLLAPAVAQRRDVPAGDLIYVAEIDLDALGVDAWQSVRPAEPLPRFPSAVRDISILVDDSLSAETVRGTIRAAAPRTLVAVREFDRYQGKGIPEGKVSLSLRLTFQAPDRTLTDEEVHHAMDGVAAALTTQLSAVQR